MDISDLRVIVRSLKRHIIGSACKLYRKSDSESRFDGLNEACIVSALENIYEGMGYIVWPEQRIYKGSKEKVDLNVEDPDGYKEIAVEVKVIWDPCDNRLVPSRVYEFLGDFDKLTGDMVRHFEEKHVIWVGFAREDKLVCSENLAQKYRLGTLIEVAKKKVAVNTLFVNETIDISQHCNIKDWSYVHLFGWLLK